MHTVIQSVGRAALFIKKKSIADAHGCRSKRLMTQEDSMYTLLLLFHLSDHVRKD
jgi:hypothetical protein